MRHRLVAAVDRVGAWVEVGEEAEEVQPVW